jgi:hypothetical protein
MSIFEKVTMPDVVRVGMGYDKDIDAALTVQFPYGGFSDARVYEDRLMAL